MKLKITVLIAAVLLFVSSFYSGDFILARTPEVLIVSPYKTGYTTTVNCSGEIIERSKSEVYSGVPIIASEVKVVVGDWVEKGETIAVIDQKATAAALISSFTTSATTVWQQYVDQIPIELQELLTEQGELVSLSQQLKNIPQEITAPISGTVTELNLMQGILSTSYNSVATIIDSTDLVAKVTVNESFISDIAPGSSATLTGSAFKENYYATVEKIDPTAHKEYNGIASETVIDLTLEIQDANVNLRPGYSVKASIITGRKENILSIPYKSVLQDDFDQSEYVYIYQNGRAIRQNICTGIELTSGFEVVSGITNDMQIIANPEVVKSEGELVKIRGNMT